MFFWIVVGALAVVQGLIMLTALRIRLAPHALTGPLGARPMELLWTLAPSLVLVAIAVLSFQALRDDEGSPGDLNGIGVTPVAEERADLSPLVSHPVSGPFETPSP